MKKILLILVLFLSVLNVCSMERLILATTTSTENSGILSEIIAPFEKEHNIKINVIAVGTGKAIKLAENGDADIIFVHARQAEDKFVAEGYGVNRKDVMYNDFVIVGPSSDKAGIKGKGVFESLKNIRNSNCAFVSRGDNSGTHKKENFLWGKTGDNNKWSKYFEAGQGMGATLLIADEKSGYCLTDRGTYIAYEDKIDLEILCEGDKDLLNPYGIIAVNPYKHSHVNFLKAMDFVNWVVSDRCQKIINDFKKNGKQLFYPNAGK